MTLEGFRRLALSLPGVVEAAHMGHPDFRVGGKIFATLWPKDLLGMVKLTPEQQQAFLESEPAVFVPVKGGWGKGGATHVRLAAATLQALGPAMQAAWRNVAPSGMAASEPPARRKPLAKRRKRNGG